MALLSLVSILTSLVPICFSANILTYDVLTAIVSIDKMAYRGTFERLLLGKRRHARLRDGRTRRRPGCRGARGEQESPDGKGGQSQAQGQAASRPRSRRAADQVRPELRLGLARGLEEPLLFRRRRGLREHVGKALKRVGSLGSQESPTGAVSLGPQPQLE